MGEDLAGGDVSSERWSWERGEKSEGRGRGERGQ